MKNLYKIVLLVLCMSTGCSSILDVKSDATLVVPQTIDDLQALLDDFIRMSDLKVPGGGEGVSDDYYLPESILKLYPEENRQFYGWNYFDVYGHQNDWGVGYQPIYNANLALDLLRKIEMTARNEQKWNNIKGSALFYRAFYLYNLLVVFAEAYDENTSHKDLGIVLRLTSDFNVKSHRSSVKDCFDQIESDLKASIDLLPDHPVFVTRPSKAATFALLARLYLYKRDYSQALEYADLALQLKSDLMDYKGDGDINLNASATASPFRQFNKETIFYAEQRTAGMYSPNGSRAGVVDSVLFKSYHPNDLRPALFYRIAGGLPYYRGSYTGSARMFGGLRVNELYLIKAECLLLLGETTEGFDILNKLLENRFQDFKALKILSVSNQEAIKIIRAERRRELVYCGLRFSDIKRYNREGANITLRRIIDGEEYLLEPNSKKYALKIPADLIELVGLEQN